MGRDRNRSKTPLSMSSRSCVPVAMQAVNVALDAADRAADVLIALRTAGVPIESVSVAKPTLDEVFLAITGHDTGHAGEPEPTASALEVVR